MTDFAALGLMIDSSSVPVAERALERLVQTGRQAEQQATRQAGAVRATNTEYGRASTTYQRQVGELNNLLGRLSPASAAYQRMAADIKILDQALAANLINYQQYITALKQVTDEHRRAQGAIENKTSSWQNLVSGANIARAVFTGLAVGVLARLTQALFDAGVTADRLRISMEAATGSARGGAEALGFASRISEEMGLNFTTTAFSFQKFNAAVQGTALEGEAARKIFVSMSGAARVLGLRAEETRGMFIALEQMASKGTVSMEELRQQLGERLPGAFRLAAEAMDVSTTELARMIANGQVSADVFLPRLAARVDEVYGRKVPAAAGTAQAEMERVRNEWEALQRSFASNSGFMNTASEGFRILASNLKAAGNTMKEDLPFWERFFNAWGTIPGIGIAGQSVAAELARLRELRSRVTSPEAAEAEAMGWSVPEPELGITKATVTAKTGMDDVLKHWAKTEQQMFEMGRINKDQYIQGLKEIVAAAGNDSKLRQQYEYELYQVQKRFSDERLRDQENEINRNERDARANIRRDEDIVKKRLATFDIMKKEKEKLDKLFAQAVEDPVKTHDIDQAAMRLPGAERGITAASEVRALQDRLKSEEEQLIEGFDQQQSIIDEARELGIISAETYYEHQLAITERFNEQYAYLNNRAITSVEQFRKASFERQTRHMIGMLTEMTAGAAQHNRTMFEINKLAATANAIVKGYEGVQSAYAFGAAWGGHPAGIAMAALAAAATAIQVKAIQSTQFQGGGQGIPPSLSGSVAQQATTPLGPQETKRESQTTIIDFHGTSDEVELLDRFVSLMNERRIDGGAQIIVRHSSI